MSKTFWPLFRTNLKLTFDFRSKKQKASMLSIFFVVLFAGMAFAALYAFIFVMSAIETNTPIVSVLYTMAGFASMLALTTTIPKVKTTLFGGNDYDMLAALPIPKKEILFVKFFSLYSVEFFYTCIIVIPAGVICFIFDHNITYLIHALIMLVFVPVLPLLVACLVGTFISVISDRTKFGNIISVLFYAAFLVLVMSASMMSSAGETESMEPLFNMFKWINPTNTLLEIDIPGINYLVYILTNTVLLFVVIVMLTYFYDHIHDLLTTSRSKKKQQNIEYKNTTSSKSLLKIEFKKYFSSKGYLMNTIVGGILCIVMVGVMLSTLLTNEDPEFVAIIKDIVPYLSLMIMWCIGISTPAASAISMEGKSFWIIKTLPIDYKKYLKCKLLLSEIILAPFVLVASIILAVLSNISVEGLITIFVMPQLYLLSLNYISLVINSRFYKLTWSNEMEVVKNSKSVVFVMLIDFAYTIIMCILLIVGGVLFNLWVGAVISIVFEIIMTLVARNTLYKKCPQRIANMEI